MTPNTTDVMLEYARLRPALGWLRMRYANLLGRVSLVVVLAAFAGVACTAADDRTAKDKEEKKVPDVVYRQPTTLLNISMAILRLLGVVALLALTIAGFVIALRRGTFAWRRALRCSDSGKAASTRSVASTSSTRACEMSRAG